MAAIPASVFDPNESDDPVEEYPRAPAEESHDGSGGHAVSTLRDLGYLPPIQMAAPPAEPLAPPTQTQPAPDQGPGVQDFRTGAQSLVDQPPAVGAPSKPGDQPEVAMGDDFVARNGMKIPKYADTDAAGKQMLDMSEAADQAKLDAGKATFAATKGHGEALAKVGEDYTKALADADHDLQVQRVEAHRQAASETAAFLEKQDQLAAKEPSPHRWWENQSGFGKAMWLLGLMFSTAGSAKVPGARNTVADMINEEINSDMGRQKDRLGRQMTALKERGESMRADQHERLTDMTNDHTMVLGRLNALMEAAKTRASVAGSDDEAAAMANVQDFIATKKADLGHQIFQTTVTQKTAAVNDANQLHRQKLAQDFTDAQRVATEAHGDIEKEKDRQLTRDMSEEKIAGKIAENSAKGAKKDQEEYQDVPMEAGSPSGEKNFYVKHKDGTEEPVAFHKSISKEAITEAQNRMRTGSALIKLRDAVADTSTFDRLFNNDAARKAAEAQLVDPLVKQTGGRLTKDMADAMSVMVTGRNGGSFWDRMKSGDHEGLVKLLDDEIADQPRQTTAALSVYPRRNTKPGDVLVSGIKDLQSPKPKDKTGDEVQAEITGKAAAPVELKSTSDLKDYGSAARVQMPSDLGNLVDKATDSLKSGATSEALHHARGAALNALRDYEDAHKEAGTAVKNARVMIDDAWDHGIENADKLPEIESALKAYALYHGGTTKSEVEERLTKAGITAPTAKEIKDLVDRINASVPESLRSH